MKRLVIPRVAGAALLAAVVPAFGAIEDSSTAAARSYQGIVERNPFGLKPPAPPASATPVQPTNQVTKSDLKLTGFTTLGGKRAFFMWTEEKTKKSESFSLGVDQERDGLRVLAIDEIARSVRVTEAGSEKLLTFASHGLTNAVAIAAPTVAPGTPGAVPAANRPPGSPPPLPTPTPNVTPGSISPNAPATPGMRTIPSRNLRVQNNDVTQPTIMAGASSPLPTPVYAGGSGIPQPAPQPNHDPVQQVLMHELQRTVRPDIPPLPPIP